MREILGARSKSGADELQDAESPGTQRPPIHVASLAESPRDLITNFPPEVGDYWGVFFCASDGCCAGSASEREDMLRAIVVEIVEAPTDVEGQPPTFRPLFVSRRPVSRKTGFAQELLISSVTNRSEGSRFFYGVLFLRRSLAKKRWNPLYPGRPLAE
jgi:hypothetical protein